METGARSEVPEYFPAKASEEAPRPSHLSAVQEQALRQSKWNYRES
jgi:hypothetical protein